MYSGTECDADTVCTYIETLQNSVQTLYVLARNTNISLNYLHQLTAKFNSSANISLNYLHQITAKHCRNMHPLHSRTAFKHHVFIELHALNHCKIDIAAKAFAQTIFLLSKLRAPENKKYPAVWQCGNCGELSLFSLHKIFDLAIIDRI